MVGLVAIVVAHDSAEVLPACLAALARQHVPAIVVDNASRDGSAAIAEAAGARVIRNARNEGYGRANNRGVAAAETADRVLIVNPDVVLRPGAVDALLAAARAWPDAGCWRRGLMEPDGRFFYQARSLLAAVLTNPGGRLCAAPGRCLRAVPVRGLPDGRAHPCSSTSAASTTTSSCSTRMTTCAGGWPMPGAPSSTSTVPRRCTARPLLGAGAGPDLPVALAPGVVAGLCQPQIRPARPERVASHDQPAEGRALGPGPARSGLERYGGSASGALAFLRGQDALAREGLR